jgi:hypothetical protein
MLWQLGKAWHSMNTIRTENLLALLLKAQALFGADALGAPDRGGWGSYN